MKMEKARAKLDQERMLIPTAAWSQRLRKPMICFPSVQYCIIATPMILRMALPIAKTLKQLSGLAMPSKGLRLEGGRVSGKNLRLKMRWIAATTARTA